MPDGAKETRVDRILKALKNHSLLSVLIVAGVVVIALANFTSAWQTLRSFVSEMRGEPTKSALIAEYCNLVAPLVAQLDRTEKAIKERWTEGNEALERSTIRDANLKARELLMTRRPWPSSQARIAPVYSGEKRWPRLCAEALIRL